jgi:translation initiation factor 2 subunit 1
MSEADKIWPEEGELLVCTVKGVKENGAYLNLDGYGDKEGFVFIGEVASGWVKNIRAHLREGQRVVAKVVTIKKDRERVDLSIKAVSAERRKDTLQTWKNQQRANQIIRVAAERVNWDKEKTEAISEEMTEKFGSLYGALEECAISETALSDSGFTGKWIKVVTELAVENIVPPFVEIRGVFDIEVWGSEGVGAIREALSEAELVVENEEEVTLTCHYDGAPHYRVDIRAPDYSLAETAWEAAKKAAAGKINSVEGSISIERL